MDMVSDKVKPLFYRFVDVLFGVILLLIILGISIGTVELLATTWGLLSMSGLTGHYIDIITDVLTLYVLIELARSLVEYFDTHKLRLTFIVDAAIVFVLRELMIGLFKHQISVEMMFALSALIFVLGALRISSILVYQRERALAEKPISTDV
jgi:uncharacterized membrane protein (DUF373 family)